VARHRERTLLLLCLVLLVCRRAGGERQSSASRMCSNLEKRGAFTEYRFRRRASGGEGAEKLAKISIAIAQAAKEEKENGGSSGAAKCCMSGRRGCSAARASWCVWRVAATCIAVWRRRSESSAAIFISLAARQHNVVAKWRAHRSSMRVAAATISRNKATTPSGRTPAQKSMALSRICLGSAARGGGVINSGGAGRRAEKARGDGGQAARRRDNFTFQACWDGDLSHGAALFSSQLIFYHVLTISKAITYMSTCILLSLLLRPAAHAHCAAAALRTCRASVALSGGQRRRMWMAYNLTLRSEQTVTTSWRHREARGKTESGPLLSALLCTRSIDAIYDKRQTPCGAGERNSAPWQQD